ncbi:hypothetical protein Tco_0790559 [Tanacetum coccineum]
MNSAVSSILRLQKPKVHVSSLAPREISIINLIMTQSIDDGNPSRVNIKQLCDRFKRRCYNAVPAKSDSSPHAYTQAFKVNHLASRLLILNFLIIKDPQHQIKNRQLGNIRRTKLSPHEIGSWEISDIKGAFKKDVIPFSENLKETFKLFEKGFVVKVKEMKDIFEQMEDEVDQCSMAKKSFKIEKKQLLINNDRVLEENIASDIMCTYCGKCKSLDIVLLDLQESNKSLSELRKHFANNKEYDITVDIDFQNHKEQMNLNNPNTKNK